jgi:hypothetical protein
MNHVFALQLVEPHRPEFNLGSCMPSAVPGSLRKSLLFRGSLSSRPRADLASMTDVPVFSHFICRPRVTAHVSLPSNHKIEQDMATPFTLNPRAASGFQNASNYDTHRPSYPAEAVDKLLTHLGVANQKNARIVDLACGTGKFTELLAEREEEFEVVGIEPHAGMREELVKKKLRGVKVLEGDAGHMPIESGWGDTLIAAQVSCSS